MRAVSRAWPRSSQLTLIVTRRCQKACPECPVAVGLADMRRGILKKAITFFSPGRRKAGVVKFFGGEPLLRFDLVKYGLAELARHGYAGRVEVGTNGVLLDAAALEYFSRRPGVQINLNSFVTVNRRVSALPNLVWNLLIPSQKPLSALRVLARVLEVSRGAPPRVNVLPAYYRRWGKPALLQLARTLRRIRGLSDGGLLKLENAERSGPVPLFNGGLTVNADGRVYNGNLILAVKTPGAAQALLAGDLNLPGGKITPARARGAAFAAGLFGAEAAASGFAVDALAEKILLG